MITAIQIFLIIFNIVMWRVVLINRYRIRALGAIRCGFYFNADHAEYVKIKLFPSALDLTKWTFKQVSPYFAVIEATKKESA